MIKPIAPTCMKHAKYNYLPKYPEIRCLLEATNCTVSDYYVKTIHDAKVMIRPRLIKLTHKNGLFNRHTYPMRYIFFCFDRNIIDPNSNTLEINGISTPLIPLPTSNSILYADLGPNNIDYSIFYDPHSPSLITQALGEMDICQSSMPMHRIDMMCAKINEPLRTKLVHVLGWIYHMQYDLADGQRVDRFVS